MTAGDAGQACVMLVLAAVAGQVLYRAACAVAHVIAVRRRARRWQALCAARVRAELLRSASIEFTFLCNADPLIDAFRESRLAIEAFGDALTHSGYRISRRDAHPVRSSVSSPSGLPTESDA